jgi:hypothetical protein
MKYDGKILQMKLWTEIQIKLSANQMAYSSQNHLMLPINLMITSLAKWANLGRKCQQRRVSHRIHA